MIIARVALMNGPLGQTLVVTCNESFEGFRDMDVTSIYDHSHKHKSARVRYSYEIEVFRDERPLREDLEPDSPAAKSLDILKGLCAAGEPVTLEEVQLLIDSVHTNTVLSEDESLDEED